MSRYRGPRLRVLRRLGSLPGLTSKSVNRTNKPGQHGQANSTKKTISNYGVRLQEKQKLRYNYGVNEKQLFNYVKEARRLKGATGTLLLQLLEMRLDNIVYRSGFSPTIPSARQLVNHGLINVNGKRVDIPSFQCQPTDIITIKDKENIRNLVKQNLTLKPNSVFPSHLEVHLDKLMIKVNNFIKRSEIGVNINELLIVEFYSRK